jgi:hypothetical protein
MICQNCKSSYSSICLKCGYDPKINEAKFSTEDLGISGLPHVPMEESHIWLGLFPSGTMFDEYFEEGIEEDDATPMNNFAKDQGEVFYDHDWVEISFRISDQLSSLLKGHSYCKDYMNDVIRFAKANNIKNANTFIMADANEIKSPRSVKHRDISIWYIGKYKCNV